MLARCPRRPARRAQAFDQLVAAGAGDLLGERLHEHAPAAAGALVDVVDLERDPGVVGGRGDLRGVGADDDGVAVEHVVDRQDQRERPAREADAAELAGGQQRAALVGGQHDECRVALGAVPRRVLGRHGTPPRVRSYSHGRSHDPDAARAEGPGTDCDPRYGSARRLARSVAAPPTASTSTSYVAGSSANASDSSGTTCSRTGNGPARGGRRRRRRTAPSGPTGPGRRRPGRPRRPGIRARR